MPRLGPQRGGVYGPWPWIALGAAMVVAALVIGLAGRGLVLSGDEWGYAGRLASEPVLEAIVEPPPGKYLIALPLLLYAGLLEAFGADNYLPFRIAGIAMVLLTAGLVFEFTRRRTGPIVALAPAILLLVFGAAAEVVAQPVRLPSLFAVAGGIGAWLALDARTRPGDSLACALTLISLTSHPIGLAFTAGTAALVLLGRPGRRARDSWVFAIPLAVLAVWWVTGREAGQDQAAGIGDVASFAADSLLIAATAITGLFHDPLGGRFDPLGAAGWIATALVVGVIAWGVARQRGIRAEWVAVAVALAVALAAPALAPGPERLPTAGRYLYPTGVLLLLLVAESLRGVRPRRPVAVAIAAAPLVALALHSNVWALLRESDDFVERSRLLRGELAALDVARGSVSGDFVPSEIPSRPARTGYQLDARTYYAVHDEYGSPAFTPEELARQNRQVRELADLVLESALGDRGSPSGSVAP